MAMCSVGTPSVLPWGTATPPPMPVVRVVSRAHTACLSASASVMSVVSTSRSARAKMADCLSSHAKGTITQSGCKMSVNSMLEG